MSIDSASSSTHSSTTNKEDEKLLKKVLGKEANMQISYPCRQLLQLRKELQLFNEELLEKPLLIYANKCDITDEESRQAYVLLEKYCKAFKLPLYRGR
jgi:GTPase involved in cell partitioning and DNA repair